MTFLCVGILLGWMKNIVLLQVGIMPFTPCAKLSKSFARAFTQIYLSGPWMRWRYSRETAVSGLMTLQAVCSLKRMGCAGVFASCSVALEYLLVQAIEYYFLINHSVWAIYVRLRCFQYVPVI